MILVTGANGKAASEVVRGFSQRGRPVRALVRSLANAKAIEGPGIEIVQGDLAQAETLPGLLEGVDAVFLATGLAPDLADLHRNLIEAATGSDVGHVVRLSVLPAATDAPIRGPRLHGEADQALIESGIPYTLVKPAHFMQNLLAFAGPIAAQGLIPAPLGHASIGTIDVRDVAAVAVAALTGEGHEGESYIITGPESLTMDAMAERLSSALGSEVKYVDVPPEAAREALLKSGAPDQRQHGGRIGRHRDVDGARRHRAHPAHLRGLRDRVRQRVSAGGIRGGDGKRLGRHGPLTRDTALLPLGRAALQSGAPCSGLLHPYERADQ